MHHHHHHNQGQLHNHHQTAGRVYSIVLFETIFERYLWSTFCRKMAATKINITGILVKVTFSLALKLDNY